MEYTYGLDVDSAMVLSAFIKSIGQLGIAFCCLLFAGACWGLIIPESWKKRRN